MADPKHIPPEHATPELPGGSTRRSVEVDLSDLPAIAGRRKLNDRLLAGTCGIDAPPDERFDREDLDLLLLIAMERFGGGGALLRRLAISALGTIEADEAVRRLVDLGLSVVEHDQVRLSALAALPAERQREVVEQLVDDPSPAVRQFVRWATGEETPGRRKVPGQVPLDPEAAWRLPGDGP